MEIENTNMRSPEEIQSLIPKVLKHIDECFPFAHQRRGQKLLILRIVKTYLEGKKFFILESPTGTGKSVIAYTAMRVISRLMDIPDRQPKATVLTKTKGLQTQYEKSFTDVPTLWSASGYKCNRDPYNEEAYYGSYACDKRLCPFFQECDYNNAKNAFMASEMGVLNYAFFLAMADFKADLITLDECHSLEHLLCDHLSVKFNYKVVEKALDQLIECRHANEAQKSSILTNLDAIIEVEQTEGWFGRVKDSIKKMTGPMMQITSAYKNTRDAIDENKIEIGQQEKKKLFFYGQIIKALFDKMAKLKFSNVEWIIADPIEGEEETIEFKPISLAEEANSLFRRGQFFILMSATICGIPAFASSLGLTPEMYSSESLDSVVPIENRRVHSIGLPGFSIKSKEMIFPKYIEFIDSIIGQVNSDTPHRGVIHSVTFENADYILNKSKYASKMFVPNAEEILDIKKVMQHKHDRIAVSPSLTEGSDLEGDLCRFSILLKVPYPYLGDAWIKRKREISADWYVRETINTLVQCFGRGVRSETDWCYNFILDGNFDRLIPRTDLFPAWFSKAIVRA